MNASTSFLPDVQLSNSFFHRLKSNFIRSSTLPPRPSPYRIHHRYSPSPSLSSLPSDTDPSSPTTPLSNVFSPTTSCADPDLDNDLFHQDIHIIRHSHSLPWLRSKPPPLHDLDNLHPDPSDAIPDSPTLPASLALPEPEPLSQLHEPDPTPVPTPAHSPSPPPLAPRPLPTLHIPPAPSYPPPVPLVHRTLPANDTDSRWDGETIVGDPDAALPSYEELQHEFQQEQEQAQAQEYQPEPEPEPEHHAAEPDWTLHLSRRHRRPLPLRPDTLAPHSRSAPNTAVRTDWTLELPVSSRPPTPVPPIPATATAAATAIPTESTLPKYSARSQCPSSWFHSPPYPLYSSSPSLTKIKKTKSAQALLPLPPTLTRVLQPNVHTRHHRT